MLGGRRALAALAVAAVVGGCASTPEPLRGEFSNLPPGTATATDTGAQIRWGGRLLDVRPERERTCFEILSLPLTDTARPDTDHAPGRRFLACRDGFADPAAYPKNRLVTVTGELTGFTRRAIGEYEYQYPQVSMDTIHLWPRARPRTDPHPVGMPWWYYDPYPFRGPYPYWGPRHW